LIVRFVGCVVLSFVGSLISLPAMSQAAATSQPAALSRAAATSQATAASRTSARATGIAVGPQYDTTHVYIARNDFDAFAKSFVATFGGQASKVMTSTVTPTPSSTQFQSIRTPVGALSAFAFSTPIPFPFGQERTGYLVSDMDRAIKAARAAGAAIVVEPFKDPIGMDAVIEWPGGLKMQLYWHFTASTYDPFVTIPENRVYVSQDRADALVRSFTRFSNGKVTTEKRDADGTEIGCPGEVYRRIRLESAFGKMQIMVTDGHLPYPFGYETTGYEVKDLQGTLDKANSAGVKMLSAPTQVDARRSVIVGFPGGYIAEIHSNS
jgi:predicted enzyme related to lactoylglutathione lyase